jgi:hypothetical protein
MPIRAVQPLIRTLRARGDATRWLFFSPAAQDLTSDSGPVAI